MRVLFVHPFHMTESRLEQELMSPYPPLGLLTLAAVVRQRGYPVKVYDGTFREPAAYERELVDWSPDVVCIGAMVTLRPGALRMAGLAREAGARVIAGGPDPTTAPAAYLGPVGPFDVVVRGEAEEALPRVLALWSGRTDALAGTAIPGVVRSPYEPAPAGPAPPAAIGHDLDSLPLPARDLIDLAPYLDVWRRHHGYSSLNLAVARGCTVDCAACSERNGGAPARLRSPEHVAGEMKLLETVYQPDRFRIVDELAGLDPEWIAALDTALDDLGVATGYEGLRPAPDVVAGHFQPVMDLCATRSSRLPMAGPHGPLRGEAEAIHAAWASAGSLA